MTKDQMICALIEYKLNDWVYSQSCIEGLEELLCAGFKGYDSYTKQELKDEIDYTFGVDEAKELLKSRRARIKTKLEQKNTQTGEYPF